MLIDQISIFVANQPGRLTEITSVLAGAGIDIRALSLADTTDFGILRLIVNNPVGAEEALKGRGLTVRKTKVIAAKLYGFLKSYRGLNLENLENYLK